MKISWITDAGSIESVEFDTHLRETRDGTNTIADHPVGGRVFSDHVTAGPQRLAFDCYVSDSPGDVPTTHTGGRTGSVQKIDLRPGTTRELAKSATDKKAGTFEEQTISGTASVLKFDGALRRRDLVYQQLEALRRERREVFVTDAVLPPADQLVIARVGASLEQDSGDAITFQIELREMLVADSVTVEVPEEPRARRVRDAGPVTTEEVGSESILHSFFFGGA